jgi:hypothetical protein
MALSYSGRDIAGGVGMSKVIVPQIYDDEGMFRSGPLSVEELTAIVIEQNRILLSICRGEIPSYLELDDIETRIYRIGDSAS